MRTEDTTAKIAGIAVVATGRGRNACDLPRETRDDRFGDRWMK